MVVLLVFFFFNDTATTEIYTLSLHDALPISVKDTLQAVGSWRLYDQHQGVLVAGQYYEGQPQGLRSEEHTSELQSRQYLVCRLLLEKKKKKSNQILLRDNDLINKHVQYPS